MCAVQLLRVSVHERILAAAEDFLLQLEKGEEAAEVPVLRALLTERLTAAAEQIVALLEETVAEYEDRVERSEREICRQRRLLDAVLKPKVRIHQAVSPADVQELLVSEEEVPPEQQEWSSRVEQEQPEPPHIKEEQEELWTSQEGEQLQGLEEADIIKFSFTPVPSDSDDETSDSPEPESDDSFDDWIKPSQTKSGLNCNTGEKSTSCSDGGETGCSKESLNKHKKGHTVLFWIIQMLSCKLQMGLDLYWLNQGDTSVPADNEF
ncbi:uncharacterized protein ACBR49_017793 [Aulostomus maculatus]